MTQFTESTRTDDPRLARVLHLLGNVAIVVSAVTPAVAIFVIGPIALASQGTGAFLTFVIAGIIAVGVAFSYAELGARIPIAGGEYSFVARILGRPLGFVTLILMLVLTVMIPSSVALGGAGYFAPIANVDANLLGAIIIVVAALVAIAKVDFNARLAGVFLTIELLALLVLIVLGVVNFNSGSVDELFTPHLFGENGDATAVSFGVLMTGVAVALFAYNGYGGAVYFSEEMATPRREIAHAVLWAVGVTLVAELIPLTAVILGAPSVVALTTDEAPFQYFLTATTSQTFNDVISVIVFLAVVNATLAIVLFFSRIVWSSGRDGAWPPPISRAIGHIHPRLRTPWIATLLIGAVGAVLTGSSDVASLATYTGTILAVTYVLVGASALVDRLRNPNEERPYRMPLWPIPPLVAIGGSGYVVTKQAEDDLVLTAIFAAGALVYYFAYLHWSNRWNTARLHETEAEAVASEDAAVTGGEH